MHVDEVDVSEHGVGAERCVHVRRLGGVRVRVARDDDAVLEHAWDVVHDRTREYREDRFFCAARVAHRGCPQRVTHGDEPLDREADGEVDGARLCDERRRVGVRVEVRVRPVVPLQLPRREVYDRERHEEHQRYQHERVADAQRDQVVGRRRFHARVREDDDRENVAEYPESGDDVARDAPRVVLEVDGLLQLLVHDVRHGEVT